MKKLILMSSLAIMFVSLSAFGQGYFTFTGSTRQVWDGWSTAGVAKNDITNSVAFLWGSGTPLVDSIQSAVSTNALAGVSASGTTNGAYSVTTAWADILGDSSFHLATNFANGLVVTTNSNANGSWVYQFNGGQAFGVTNTAPNFLYQIFAIGWDNAGGLYLTPQAAAAAGVYVGWSSVFNYTSTDVPPLGNPPAMTITSFGVAGAVPEPGTMALAGLGGLLLLAFRRRKS